MKNSIPKGDPKALANALDALSLLDPQELNARWKALFGSEPPDRLRRSLMIQALAHRLQVQALGGLKPSTRRLRHSVATGADTRRQTAVGSKRPIKVGAVLIREWHGTKHQVTALKGRIHVSRKALSIAVKDRWRDHRHAIVRPSLFRSEEFAPGATTWNPLNRRPCDAQSIRASPRKKDSSRISTRYTRA
jgi:Protein of unknown function (DUF2924)